MKFKNFLKTAIIFFIGSVLSKLINFIFIPIYTNYFSPEQFGIYDFVNTIINLIAPVAFMQIWDGMFRFAFDYDDDIGKRKVINNTVLVFFMCIPIYLVSFSIVYLWLGYDYYAYVFAYGLSFMLQYIYSYAARVYMKNKLFSVSGVIDTFVVAVSNIVLIVFLKWDIKALYISSMLGFLVKILIIESRLHILKDFKLSDKNKKLIVAMVKFSLPLCLATISYWLFSGFTKLVVLKFLGEAANGLYAAANRFAYAITLFVSVFQFAWNEAAYVMSKDDNRTEVYRICIDIMLKGVLIGTAVMCLAIKIIFPYFVGEKFLDAIWLIPPTMIGVAANSLAGFLATLFMTEKKTGTILGSTFVAISVNVVLCCALTYFFGLIGSVTALAVAFALMMVIRLIQLQRKYELIITAKSTLFLLLNLILSVVIFYLCNDTILIILSCLLFAGVLLFSMKKYVKLIFSKKK